jgi:N-carbamoylputrescine amidase
LRFAVTGRINPLKVTVCELPNDPVALTRQWKRLTDHTRAAGSDLVLLPEMPFHPWLAAAELADPEQWHQAVAAHQRWIQRLPELGAGLVMGTRPMVISGSPCNQGFAWTPDGADVPTHTKYYLPDEAGYWEASWYQRGEGVFETIDCGGAAFGFLICTEIWFLRHARDYGRHGAHIIVCPRVTPASSTDKWIAGGRTAAVVSGAYCLSSNLVGPNIPGSDFGGTGWVIEPEAGDVLGTTSASEPFLTMDIDIGRAEAAKTTYPRYVAD